MTTTVQSEPLAVWDARDAAWGGRYGRGAREWAKQHIDDADSTFRVEFHMTADGPAAVLHRFARDGVSGRIPVDPVTGGAATAEPVLQILDELPPRHLLRGTGAG